MRNRSYSMKAVDTQFRHVGVLARLRRAACEVSWLVLVRLRGQHLRVKGRVLSEGKQVSLFFLFFARKSDERGGGEALQYSISQRKLTKYVKGRR